MTDWENVRYFLAIAREGSVRAAAERLGVTHSTVLRRIAQFEERLGAQMWAFRQNSSKDLTVWALEGDCDPSEMFSNTFEMMWLPKSGKVQSFPGADRGAGLGRKEALVKGRA